MKTLLCAVALLITSSAWAQSPYLQGYNPQTGQHDKYLGNLNANKFDPNSVNNPFGQYGSPYSPNSVTNPYGPYGSPYSPLSPINPYAPPATTPRIYGR